MSFEVRSLTQLRVVDEKAFLKLPIYSDLKSILGASNYTFRVLPKANWDRALLLNLAFWSVDGGGDVLPNARIEADVVTHVAWHFLAGRALALPGGGQSVRAMFLGESIASAFDLYLIGHLLRAAPGCDYLATQVPALAQAAQNAGMNARKFESLVRAIATHPEGAFQQLRALLMDAACALYACEDAESAQVALAGFDDAPFAPLLHHYELATWVLHARVHGKRRVDRKADAVDRALRSEDAVSWLERSWVHPARPPASR
jgi:hypothetical protein